MDVLVTDEYAEWYGKLTDKQKKRVAKISNMLEMMGKGLLGTNYAKSIIGAEDIYELVIQVGGQPFRVLYGVDEERDAALLMFGGNKKGDDRFYKRLVPRAEARFAEWLAEHND